MGNWNKGKADSEKRVKNVIKGFVSKFGMKEMTLISDKHDSVIFDGKIEDFLNPDEVMKEYAEEMQNEHVHRVMNHNDKKLFMVERLSIKLFGAKAIENCKIAVKKA